MAMNQEEGKLDEVNMSAFAGQESKMLGKLGELKEEIAEKASPWPIITEGEIVRLKGVLCRVKYLDQSGNMIMLAVMSADDCRKLGLEPKPPASDGRGDQING